MEKMKLEEISSLREILIEYLDKSFDERKEIFHGLFNVIDECVKKGDIQSLALNLDSLTKLANSSPFKDLVSIKKVRSILEDPDDQFEL